MKLNGKLTSLFTENVGKLIEFFVKYLCDKGEDVNIDDLDPVMRNLIKVLYIWPNIVYFVKQTMIKEADEKEYKQDMKNFKTNMKHFYKPQKEIIISRGSKETLYVHIFKVLFPNTCRENMGGPKSWSWIVYYARIQYVSFFFLFFNYFIFFFLPSHT